MLRHLIFRKIHAVKTFGIISLCLCCSIFAAAQTADKIKQAETSYDEGVKLIKQNTVEAVEASLPKFIEARKLYEEAGNKEKKLEMSENLGILLQKLADEFLRREDYAKSADFYNQALPYYRETKNRVGEAGLLHNLGFIFDKRKEPQKAKEYFEQALTAYRETKNSDGEMAILSNLASVNYGAGDYEHAADFYEQGLIIAEREKNIEKEIKYLKNLGDCYENLPNYEKSIFYFDRLLQIYRLSKDAEGEASALHSLGYAATRLKNHAKAIDCYEQAVKIYRELKNAAGEATDERNIGAILYNQTNYAAAILHFENALAIRKQIKDQVNEAILLADLGDSFQIQNEYEKASPYYEQSLAIHTELKDDGETDALNKLAMNYYRSYQPLKAIPLYERALANYRAGKNAGGEADILAGLARSYILQRNYAEAKSNLEQAVTIYRTLKDEQSEAYVLINIGGVFQEQHENDRAKTYYEQALAVFQTIKDRRGEAYTLNSLGDYYSYLNRYETAVEYITNAQKIYREINDREGEYSAQSSFGTIHYALSEYEESFKNYDAALKIALELKDLTKQTSALINIALNFSALGQYDKALPLYEKVLILSGKTGDKLSESIYYNNVGYDFYKQENYEKARKYLEQSVVILHEQKARREEGYALHNLGLVYYKLKNYEQALKLYDQALVLYLEVKDQRPESFLYDSYGEVYRDSGQFDKAAAFLEKSLILSREIKYQNVEASALTNLMKLWERLKQPRLAAFYGKQAVNVYQAIRGGNRNLDKEAQKSFLQSNEKTYRELADLLIAQGRLPEAQQILDMLKEEEFYGFVRRDASEIEKLSQRADLTADETAALKRYQTISAHVSEIGLEFGKLQDKKNQLPETEKLTPDEQKHFDDLAKQLEDATVTFQVFLRGLAEEFTKKPKVVEEIQENTGLQADLKTWGDGIVALYTVVGDERYRVIVTTPDAQTDGKTEISAADLNAKIAEFRQAVQNPNVDPRPLGKELYDILIKPIEKQLSDAKTKTLLWSLDGTLRYLPLAALWDGNQYFGQKYENVVITLASRTRLSEPVSADWRVLGLGVTDAQSVLEPNGTEKINFNALPAVRNELKAIVSDESTKEKQIGVLPGIVLLNENFTEAALKDRLSKGYKVIHIASHFSFRPGNETKSFLLLGDGSALSLVKVRTSPQLKFKGVELLTLSACQTAVGETDATGREIESFGEIAQQNGAKAVLATLWSVADESTRILMSEFYRIRTANPKITKSEAMRLAQKELLNGKYTADEAAKKRSELINLDGKTSTQPPFVKDPNAPFAHPFYWSPFILFGNWR